MKIYSTRSFIRTLSQGMTVVPIISSNPFMAPARITRPSAFISTINLGIAASRLNNAVGVGV